MDSNVFSIRCLPSPSPPERPTNQESKNSLGCDVSGMASLHRLVHKARIYRLCIHGLPQQKHKYNIDNSCNKSYSIQRKIPVCTTHQRLECNLRSTSIRIMVEIYCHNNILVQSAQRTLPLATTELVKHIPSHSCIGLSVICCNFDSIICCIRGSI